MGTYETRNGCAVSSTNHGRVPSRLVEDILGLLERAGICNKINDKIVALVAEGELKAFGSKYQPTGTKANRTCPRCTCEMTWLLYGPPTHENNIGPDAVCCEHCGYKESPSEADQEVFARQHINTGAVE